jgi:hypothetical protein
MTGKEGVISMSESKYEMDVIIVANTTNKFLRGLTESAIRTCREADDVKYNFVVVEQNKDSIPYSCKTLYYDFPFNYNRCLNLGIRETQSSIVAMCNNDLTFYKNWGHSIIDDIDRCESLSPAVHSFSGIKIGYEVGKQVLGWCIVTTREVLKKIGGLNESCDFWFSDNVYAEQLKFHKVVHGLSGNSVVRHLTSCTLRMVDSRKQWIYQRGQYKRFEDFKKNLWMSA